MWGIIVLVDLLLGTLIACSCSVRFTFLWCFVDFKCAFCFLDRSVDLNLVLAGRTHFTVRKKEKRLIWHVWRVWKQRRVEQQLQHRGQRGWRAQSSCRSSPHQEQWAGVHLSRWESWHGLVQVFVVWSVHALTVQIMCSVLVYCVKCLFSSFVPF